MRCPTCKKIMEADIENQRYICKCGKIINWVTSQRDNNEVRQQKKSKT